ncbi:24857_t:CDS:2 [Gigaspora margarita]|uniref:24857_t:CDS:1 n=1 Tax=Gigaspora margarita TaxID=4874 RepID=A0ABN7V715_GIGMA|nr:24857_t:CDS:2 [Gigaspora margarita]
MATNTSTMSDRNISSDISNSPAAPIIPNLKKIGQLVGEDEATYKILQDVLTQWNSTYLMLLVYITIPTTKRRNNNLNK